MNSDRRKGTAEEPGHERGGGWKLPLLCAAAAAAAAVLFWGLKAATTSDPAIDSELMEISTSWMQEVTENSSASFNSEIQAAVRGYTTAPARDASVAAIGRRSIDDGRLDMACAVTRYIQNRELRLSLLRDIDNTARGSCATLPWSAFAVRSIADDDPSMAATLAREVNSRWEACPERPDRKDRKAWVRIPGISSGMNPMANLTADRTLKAGRTGTAGQRSPREPPPNLARIRAMTLPIPRRPPTKTTSAISYIFFRISLT